MAQTEEEARAAAKAAARREKAARYRRRKKNPHDPDVAKRLPGRSRVLVGPLTKEQDEAARKKRDYDRGWYARKKEAEREEASQAGTVADSRRPLQSTRAPETANATGNRPMPTIQDLLNPSPPGGRQTPATSNTSMPRIRDLLNQPRPPWTQGASTPPRPAWNPEVARNSPGYRPTIGRTPGPSSSAPTTLQSGQRRPLEWTP